MSSGGTRRRLRCAAVWLGALCAALTLAGSSAEAQVVEADLRGSVFLEPSSESQLLVVHPAVSVSALPSESLRIRAGYEADIVSGATEAVKSGRFTAVDVVTAATDFSDVRHVASGGFTWSREATELTASYAYGTESDYRSHSVALSASTTFFQKNTELVIAYARGFDEVCTSAYADADAPSLRPRLDSSSGCFTDDPDRAARDIDLDSFQAGWTQTWTPVLATQLVFSGALQHGFLGNPYRAVVIAPAGDEALEYHPENRARAALAGRVKLYVRAIETAFSGGVRLYRDTWDVVGQTYEVEAERYFFSGFRALVRARYYTQSGALFYSDDYTGGEPVDGPRGQYWTGDRELSPLDSFLVGGRFVLSGQRGPGERLFGALLRGQVSFGLDVTKTNLERFTWSGESPDDTLSFLASLGLGALF